MKKILFLLPVFAMNIAVAAPRDSIKVNDKVSIKAYGFVRNYFNFDSRKTMTVCGGDYNMIPYDEDWNITAAQAATLTGVELQDVMQLRYDRNDVPQAQFVALSSRMGLALTGPTILGASSSGRFEGDFAGFGTSNTVLRLRLAYLRLDWQRGASRHTLLVGQDWHPLSGDIMPDALGMAAGAPFRPHSRTPQVRYELLSNGFTLMATALYQYQFTSPGPSGDSWSYANQALVPELFAGIGYRNEHIISQLGVDYTPLNVRSEMSTTFNNGTTATYLLEKKCHSFSSTLYFQYIDGLFSLKMRSTLAQNLGHLNMLSGYALVMDNDNPNDWSYKPLSASVTYLDLAYGRKWKFNLLTGYHKNLGLADGYSIVNNKIYMKKGVNNINSFYRVAPSVSYNTKAFNVGLEYEMTSVAYGDLQSDGTVADNDNLHNVVNHRICLMVKYNF